MSDGHQQGTHEPWESLPKGLADHLHGEAGCSGSITDLAIVEAHSVLDHEPTIIVDLGPGTGVGSVALAEEFTDAHVHGIDISTELLQRCLDTVGEAGLRHDFSVHEANLSDSWSLLIPGPADLVWAALSLHHVSDPSAALREAFTALRPGGVLVLVELPASAQSGGAAKSHADAHHPSHRHGDSHGHRHPGTEVNWHDRLVEAGFTVQRQRSAAFDMHGSPQHREIWIATR